jgi:pyruvate,water dikinase
MELSRRWDLGRDVFFLHFDELETFEVERDRLQKEIEKRKMRWQSAQRLDYSRVVDSQKLENLGLSVVEEEDEEEEADEEADAAPARSKRRKELKSDALAAGVFTGSAHIVFDPKEAGEIASDCILVCPSTDPGWTALFASIKGLIVERGGALSHGAITARDFGIPAVACPDATKKISEGARIRVDGNRGKVAILEA